MFIQHAAMRRAGFSAALLGGVLGQQQAIVEPGGWADFGDQGHCTAWTDAEALRHDPQTDRAEEWVNAHNHYRACHGSGGVVWNPQLAEYAKAWVEKILRHCDGMTDLWSWVDAAERGVHRPHDGDSYFEQPRNGENIWTGGGVTGAGGYSFEAGAVTSWYQEVTNSCPTRGRSPGCGGGAVNHYTAMIWKDVREIGCYIATLDTASGPFSVASCRYSPGAGRDELEGCSLPNMKGCDLQQVPALVGGECPRLDGAGAAPAAPAEGAHAIGWQPYFGEQDQGSFSSVGLGNFHLPTGEDIMQGVQHVREQLGFSSGVAPPAAGAPALSDSYSGSGSAWQTQPQVQTQTMAVNVGFQLPSVQGVDFHGLTGLSSGGARLRSSTSMLYALPLLVLCFVGSSVAACRLSLYCCRRLPGRSASAGPSNAASRRSYYASVPLEPGALVGPSFFV